jgi:hypothetical protein
MFALVACLMFVISAVCSANHWSGTAGHYLLWALLGFAAWSLHSAYAIGLPVRRQPPQG